MQEVQRQSRKMRDKGACEEAIDLLSNGLKAAQLSWLN